MRTPSFMQLFELDRALLAAEAVQGLSRPNAAVSPKFFYDPLGSRLFEAITELAEYYPTRTEAAIFAGHGAAIGAAANAALGLGFSLIDLGAGNCRKAASLFAGLALSRYVAVDISADFLREALAELQPRHAQLEMVGVGLDFSSRLTLPSGLAGDAALVFYPGSSIGNFTPEAALALLRQARELSPRSALLIGVDLVKDTTVLEAAYDDELGVTAAFNLNLLRHLNGLIGSDFEPRGWRHVSFFDEAQSRIEMHLQARCDLAVRWPGGERRFAAGERIHTENSYKWRADDFAALLRDAGFTRVRRWSDDAGAYAVMLAS